MHMIQHTDSFSTKDPVEDGLAESSHDVDATMLLFCDNLAVKILPRIDMKRIEMMKNRRFVWFVAVAIVNTIADMADDVASADVDNGRRQLRSGYAASYRSNDSGGCPCPRKFGAR